MTERRSTSETPAPDPRLLVTETPAPPEAVRAIAALLGRAAAPLAPAPRRRPPTPQSDVTSAPATTSATSATSATSTASTRDAEAVSIDRIHDHEVLVEGEHSELLRLAEDEIERAARRARRAKRAVREALDRISAPAGDDLGG